MTVRVENPVSSHPLADLVRSRRSVRNFLPNAVPRGVLEEIFAEALWAPSPHNSQPWRFTVLTALSERSALAAAMAARLKAELQAERRPPAEVEALIRRSRSRIASAPVAILCSTVDDGLVIRGDVHQDFLERQMAVQSVGAVLQTLFLSAQARGLGTCWMAAPMYCPEDVRAALRLPPAYSPQALALMGFSAGGEKTRPRQLPTEVVDFR